jgi:hypothetical protein
VDRVDEDGGGAQSAPPFVTNPRSLAMTMDADRREHVGEEV